MTGFCNVISLAGVQGRVFKKIFPGPVNLFEQNHRTASHYARVSLHFVSSEGPPLKSIDRYRLRRVSYCPFVLLLHHYKPILNLVPIDFFLFRPRRGFRIFRVSFGFSRLVVFSALRVT